MGNLDGKDKTPSLIGFPGELLLHILSFLSIEDVLTIRQVHYTELHYPVYPKLCSR